MINDSWETVDIGEIQFHIDKDGDLEIDFRDYGYGTSVYAEKDELIKLRDYLIKYTNKSE